MSDSAIISKPLQSDVWIYRMVVASLGISVLLSIVGAIYLVAEGNEAPDALIALRTGHVRVRPALLYYF